MRIDTGVFSRRGIGRNVLSERAFYAIIGLALIWGFALTAIMSSMFKDYIPSTMAIILLGLGLPILGVILAIKSDNAIVSFIGYNMICLPFGIILAPVLNLYSPGVVTNVFTLTLLITVAMTLSAFMFPSLYRNMGGALFIALTGFLIASILEAFFMGRLPWLHYVGTILFSLYIGYDMWRASQVPRTIDSAIDIAVDLYLDILNLFLQLLSSSKKND